MPILIPYDIPGAHRNGNGVEERGHKSGSSTASHWYGVDGGLGSWRGNMLSCKTPLLAEGLLLALTPLRGGMDLRGHGVEVGRKDRGQEHGGRGW